MARDCADYPRVVHILLREIAVAVCPETDFPILRVLFAPSLHPPDVLGTTEVISVVWLGKPMELAGVLTCSLTFRLGTVALVITIPIIRYVTLTAMKALPFRGDEFMVHGGKELPQKVFP
jgi:hypothetical protein